MQNDVSPSQVDSAPLLRLLVKHIGIRLRICAAGTVLITISDKNAVLFQNIVALFSDAQKHKWYSYVSETVQELWVDLFTAWSRPAYKKPRYRIIVKSLCAEWWMDWHATNGGTGYSTKLRDWFQRSGCPKVDSIVVSGPR
jgi:hypothetical protein